ncbi:uncharacterized protein LOC136077082 [Hydra vulgaris]|uniref:Uncharacterized protein LOC136077082 n=1 Tax=Hydra vulgaris TaxID=6087 RepID=A0ABM4BFD0_HYDVU
MVLYTEQEVFKIILDNNVNSAQALITVFKMLENINDIDEHSELVLTNTFRQFSNLKKSMFIAKRIKIDKEAIVKLGKVEVLLSFNEDMINQEDDYNSEEDTQRNRKKWDSISRKSKIRRTEELWKNVNKLAEIENIDLKEVCDFLLSRCSSSSCVKTSQITTVTAVAICCDSLLGRSAYRKLRKMLRANSIDVYPSWKKVQDFKNSITPLKTVPLPEPYIGVYSNFTESVKITVAQILMLENVHKTNELTNLVLEIKFGYDGSGGHKMYNQLHNVNTNNIIMAMFCPLKLLNSNADGNNLIWEQISPNSDFSQRPLMLQMGKESRENAQSLTVFNADIKTMKEEGFIIIFNGQYLNIKVNIVADSFDRKASNIFQGLGGAYCDLCDLSKEQCEDICTIEQGFVINRDIETMEQIFLDLVQEDGSLTKKSKDYDVRHGQTASPIAGSNVRSVQVLHALLHGFDHFMKVVVHLSAGVHAWTESKTASTTHFLEIEKKNIQELIGKKTGIKWDFADSSG